jgi:hypothetical protein
VQEDFIMSNRLVRYGGLTLVLGLGLLSFVWVSMRAQNQGGIPRTPDGRPDLNGFWLEPGIGGAFYGDGKVGDASLTVKAPDGSVFYNHVTPAEIGVKRETASQVGSQGPRTLDQILPPYKPEWREKVVKTAEHALGNLHPDDPGLVCKPYGISRGWLGNGLQVVQNPQQIAFLYEKSPGLLFRLVYMDGRPHPENVDSSHLGHSVGRWEGDTLVIDTVGLNDDTILAEIERGGPAVGMMLLHSDQLHTVERIRREGDFLYYDLTVEDPVAFTKPWVMPTKRVHRGAKEDYIMPQMCLELDREHILFKNTPGHVNPLEGLDKAN